MLKNLFNYPLKDHDLAESPQIHTANVLRVRTAAIPLQTTQFLSHQGSKEASQSHLHFQLAS